MSIRYEKQHTKLASVFQPEKDVNKRRFDASATTSWRTFAKGYILC